MIERIPFGRTGHASSRAIFGAAALGSMKPDRAEGVLALLLEYGVNHIDTAAAYGDSELRVAPWLREHPGAFFLATKTGERTRAGAREGLERSLERLGVDRVDLLQLHNLVDPEEWEIALGPGGALEAAVAAREEGLVRFIGVTGHGTRAAEMHLRSLERYAFDSVLLPCNFAMLQSPEYRADFEALVERCRQRGVAVQTIKSVARRRWVGDAGPRFSWYEPLRDPDAIRRAVHYVLRTPDVFLDTSSDATILREILEAASGFEVAPSDAVMRRDASRHGIEPLFVRGVSDAI
ncbi:MAG: aldo/keto reductase [Myxococcales bacterium]|nr:aldo/keto reductase [Myxococcales bacterium]